MMKAINIRKKKKKPNDLIRRIYDSSISFKGFKGLILMSSTEKLLISLYLM